MKLKEKYKGLVLTMSGRTIVLDNVDPKDAEKMGLSEYFEGSSKIKSKKKGEDSEFVSI